MKHAAHAALRLTLALVALAAAPGCSSEPASGASPAAGGDGGAPVEPATAADAGPPAPECAPPPATSKCKNAGAWVRGFAHFDPSKVVPGTKPVLRVTLRHAFIMVKGEEAIGGRLHGWKNVPVRDVSSGTVAFAIDMCAMGTSMWSEENDPFNLVLHLDTDGTHNLDDAKTNDDVLRLAKPNAGEQIKMVPVTVSCHAESPCVDVTLDCTDGAACTTIKPIKSCTKQNPGCGSDDAFCK